ncbi:MAG TPA: FeoB-associated Cys-rich membrane protein [Clostridiaceae bacterium]|nr:FeoB-associated Cys-rich membrane protein [Clostridiaceae bacterium]
MEIVIAVSIVAAAVFIFYRSAKKKTSGNCDCGSCTSHCPLYEDKKTNQK